MINSCITNEPQYIYIELLPTGYAITTLNYVVIEIVFDDSPIQTYTDCFDEQVYYAGPSRFVVKKDNQLIDIRDGSVVISSDIERLKAFEDSIYSKKSMISDLRDKETQSKKIKNAGITNVNVAYSYFSNLNDYGTNEGSTCTVVAASMLLGYYRHNVNTNYIASQYVTQASTTSSAGTTESFYQLLCDYVYGEQTHNAIYIRDAESGINDYLDTRNVNTDFYHTTGVSATKSKLINLINNGKPAIAAISTSHGATINHSVIAYGYMYTENNVINSVNNVDALYDIGLYYFRVNYGWHLSSYNNVLLISDWFYECGYVE